MAKDQIRARDWAILATLIVATIASILLIIFPPFTLTGAFSAGGTDWEGKLVVPASSEQRVILTHIIFDQYKTTSCADNVYIEFDGQSIPFSTENEIIIDGLCKEADVIFNNDVFGSATYNIYYGMISAATGTEQLQFQPLASQPSECSGGPNFKESATVCGTGLFSNYNLGSNLACTSNGLVLCTDNIVLDCQGYNLTGNGYVGYTGVLIAAKNTTIKNCNIKNFYIGIGNVIVSPAYRFDSSAVSGYAANETKINNDNVTSSTNYGLFLAVNSNSNVLTNDSWSNNSIKDIRSESSENNTFTDQIFSSYPTTVNFTYSGSIQLDGITSPPADPSSYRHIGKFINATAQTTAWLFMNISYTNSPVPGFDENNLIFARNNGTWEIDNTTFASSAGIDTANDYIYANITNFGSTFAPLEAATNVSSCIDITSSGYYAINTTFAPSGTKCINISASNVIFDGTGHTINNAPTYNLTEFAPGASIYYGVYSENVENITIQNLRITGSGWNYGFYLNITNNSNSINNTAYQMSGTGIYVVNSTNTTLINNTAGPTTSTGLFLGNSPNSTIRNNTAYSNSYAGIYVDTGSNYCNISNNNASLNSANYGMFVRSNYNNVTNNIFDSNSAGLFLYVGQYNNATNNRGWNNSIGLQLGTISYDLIKNNTIFDSRSVGLYLYSGAGNNNLTNNTVSNSTQWDIKIVSSGSNIFTNQTVSSYPTSFNATYSGDVFLKGVSSPPSDPLSYQNIGKYVNATNDTANAWLYLNISYADPGDLGSINENTLFMARNNGTWETDNTTFSSSSGIDTANDYIYANITDFGSIFAPLGNASGGGGPTNISNCTNITSSGHYVLNQNINSSSSCININASDVILDGQGYAVLGISLAYKLTDFAGSGPPLTSGINATNQTNVTVQNLNLTGWGYGAYLKNTNNSFLINNTASVNIGIGIYLESSSNNSLANNTANSNSNYVGIWLYLNSNNNTLFNNTANSNGVGNGVGIKVDSNSNYNNFTKNTANNNQYGIHLNTCLNNNITNNTANNNTMYGIFLESSSNYNNLINNTANKNYQGIHLYTGSNNNSLDYNTANNNNDQGIHLQLNPANNTLNYNTANNNLHYGIYLEGSGSNNILTNNIAYNNSNWDIGVSNSPNNRFINQTVAGPSYEYPTKINFTAQSYVNIKGVASPPSNPSNYSDVNAYVNATGYPNWLALNISYDESALGSMSESSLRMSRYETVGGWETNTSNFSLPGTFGVDTTNNYVYANISGVTSIFAPLGNVTPINVSTCMNLTNASETYVLNQSLSGNQSNGRCIDIQADNITLDCLSTYNLTGNSSGNTYGIYSISNNSIIENCLITNYTTAIRTQSNYATILNNSIYNYSYGIYNYYTNYSNISYNKIYNTTQDDSAIFVSHSNNNAITRNVIDAPWNGIYTLTSSNNTYISNNISNCADVALYLQITNHMATSYNNLTNCTMGVYFAEGTSYSSSTNDSALNCRNYGIYLASSANYNNITNDTVNNNLDTGIYINLDSDYNTIANSTVNNNTQFGVYIQSSAYNNVTSNTAKFNRYGMNVYFSSYNNTLTNNTANNNTEFGIGLESASYNNTLANNTANNNTYGFRLASGVENNTLINNTAFYNKDTGIYLYASSKNNITNNTANINTLYGIWLYSGSNNNSLTFNTFNGNARGIRVESGSTILNSNTANDNNYGIDIDSSSNNNLTNNTVNNNTQFGIQLSASSNNNLSNNTANNNTIYLQASSNNTLTNNTVSGNGASNGITIDNSNYTNLNSNTVSYGPSSNGVYIVSSSNNTLTSNKFGNNGNGVWLYSSPNNTLTNNTANNNQNTGIALTYSPNNNLTNNAANNNSNSGIRIIDTANNAVTNNTANNNTQNGIYLDSSSYNNLTSNTANTNTENGLYLYNGTNNNLTQNTANNNKYGISVDVNSTNNNLFNNAANNNTKVGISVWKFSNYNTLINNTIKYNTDAGISLNTSCSFNNLTNNILQNNGNGILLTSSVYNNIDNNTADGNTNGLVLQFNSSYNNLTNNTAKNNGVGITLSFNASYNTLFNNTMSNNSGTGIGLSQQSNYNNLTANTANNVNYGFTIYNSTNNDLTNNTANNNSYWSFHSSVNSLNNIVKILEIGYGVTIINFTSKDIALKNGTAIGGYPSGYINISKYVNATNNSADSWLFLNISYDNCPFCMANENKLGIARYNGTGWETNTSKFANIFGVKPDNNYVYANITGFGSTFAPLVAPTIPTPTVRGGGRPTEGAQIYNCSIIPGQSAVFDLTVGDSIDCFIQGKLHNIRLAEILDERKLAEFEVASPFRVGLTSDQTMQFDVGGNGLNDTVISLLSFAFPDQAKIRLTLLTEAAPVITPPTPPIPPVIPPIAEVAAPPFALLGLVVLLIMIFAAAGYRYYSIRPRIPIAAKAMPPITELPGKPVRAPAILTATQVQKKIADIRKELLAAAPTTLLAEKPRIIEEFPKIFKKTVKQKPAAKPKNISKALKDVEKTLKK